MSWASVGIGRRGIRVQPTRRFAALISPATRPQRGVRAAGVALAVDEQRSAWSPRRRACRRGSRARTRSATASERRSASKRATSSPSRSARAHRCGSSSRPWSANSASCIGQNAPWRAAASAAQAAASARGWLERDREVAEGDAHRALAQARLERRAERALVVAVDDRPARAAPAPATWSSGPSGGSGAEPSAQEPSSASKMRFAPGRSPGERGLVAPAHDRVRADQHERALREAARVQHAERRGRPRPWARSPRAARSSTPSCSRNACWDHVASQETP